MTLFTGENILCIRGERVVFTGLSFVANAGEALVLRGPNGSGKSTLLRLMAGLIKPHEGRLDWQGEAIHEEPEQHNARLHYVGHADAVKPVLTVHENVSFWASLRPQPDQTTKALEAFGIAYLADIPGRFLSAGQKRRTNLARILATPAPLWLLDEPTTALDAAAIRDLQQAIARHRTSGGIVIASTHAEIGLENARILNLNDFQLKDAAA